MQIDLDQLVEAIKQLPANQLVALKAEINRANPKEIATKDFKTFLLAAPVFTDDQIKLMEEARKSINQWGKFHR